MERGEAISIFAVLGVLLALAGVVVLYAQGYRLDFKKGITTTGLILVKSLPDGARVYLNDDLVAATDSSIADLAEGRYTVRIEKDGHLGWEKEVPVEPRLVTAIEALLPPISPSLNAVTQSGAKRVTAAPSGNKAIFIAKTKLYLLPLNNPFLGFLRTRPQEVAEEPKEGIFNNANSVIFSPNEDQVLVRSSLGNWLFDLGQGDAQEITTVTKLLETWKSQNLALRTDIIKNLTVPKELAEIAITPGATWSPDERKFLYEKKVGDKRQIWVANLADPLPVGEEINFMLWETVDPNLKIFWLADSHHFIVLEGKGVSLIDFDSTNRREIFNGNLTERIALSSADSAQVIVLTTFSSSNPNLYAISLR